MGDAAIETVPSKGLKPWHKKLIAAGAIVFALGASYLAGRLQTAGKIKEANTQTASAEEKASAHVSELKKQHQRLQRLEARRQLHLMLLSLDSRNFGIAKQHQQRAARLLQMSEPEAGSEFAKLQTDVETFRLVATEDLAQQRGTVLEWVKRFDKIAPPSDSP